MSEFEITTCFYISIVTCSILRRIRHTMPDVLSYNTVKIHDIRPLHAILLHPQVIHGTFNTNSLKQIFYSFKYPNKISNTTSV